MKGVPDEDRNVHKPDGKKIKQKELIAHETLKFVASTYEARKWLVTRSRYLGDWTTRRDFPDDVINCICDESVQTKDFELNFGVGGTDGKVYPFVILMFEMSEVSYKREPYGFGKHLLMWPTEQHDVTVEAEVVLDEGRHGQKYSYSEKFEEGGRKKMDHLVIIECDTIKGHFSQMIFIPKYDATIMHDKLNMAFFLFCKAGIWYCHV